MQIGLLPDTTLPNWLPDAVLVYLSHTAEGVSLRELARQRGAHASTVMRQVRRCEAMREDPLIDEALARLGERPILTVKGDQTAMTAAFRPDASTAIVSKLATEHLPDAATLDREAIRVLRRLAEAGAVLAIAADMEKAVVLRAGSEGSVPPKTVLARNVVQAFALKDWIALRSSGRVATYDITPAGRMALRRLIDAADQARQSHHAGLAEAAMPFLGAQHRHLREADLDSDTTTRKIRYNLAESPISLLGRRRDKDGHPFISPAMVQAAERLREDFELAQMGRCMTQNADLFLTAGDITSARGADGSAPHSHDGASATAMRARARVAGALKDMGPGLEDVALRVCCYLEGIEATEKRMGWAARSGKVVLRIALERLVRHYAETYAASDRLIG